MSKNSHFFMVNLVLAVIWMILNRQADIFNFLVGYGIGLGMLWTCQFFLHSSSYVHTVKGFLKFLFFFSLLFIRANFNMAKIILFTNKKNINPSFVSYPVRELSYLETLIISHMISLTPGSVTVYFDATNLWVHLIDLKSRETAIQEIDELKRLIIGFTR